MIKNTQLPPPKGLGPPEKLHECHWTKQVRETVASAFHDDLPVSIEGGADHGQFCRLGHVRADRINCHGGRLVAGDIILEIQGQKISGYTQRDAGLWLKQVSQNGAPVMIKTVPSTGKCDLYVNILPCLSVLLSGIYFLQDVTYYVKEYRGSELSVGLYLNLHKYHSVHQYHCSIFNKLYSR